ncbi:hypothetical protein ACF09L_32760 [Streptomyces sp. NPDC014779]|uniref:WDGH domain-containing protein n=1 Tax=Streptomyces sp. NPDC014779 TaxID=3364911 RepID=UPI00370061DB
MPDITVEELTVDYHRACGTIAAMHAAAVGQITGPIRGVVEDVADVRAAMLQAEAERDGVYRERAHLVALLAAEHPSVLVPAHDVQEDGWVIVYLHIPAAGQMSWHISPRDLDLFDHVERVRPDDPRAQWDGHTTAEKYDRVRAATAERMTHCGPECAEMHRGGPRCRA